MEASREVEALQVYQRFHRLNKARTQYGLTELELPSRSAYRERPVSPARTAFGHGVDTVNIFLILHLTFNIIYYNLEN